MADDEVKYTDADIGEAEERIEAKYKAELEAKETELTEKIKQAEEEKERLEEELEKKNVVIKEKDQNWSNLRKKTDAVDELKKEIDLLKEKAKASDEMVQKVAQTAKQEIIDEFIAERVGTDVEDIKLFQYRFDVLRIKATTNKEIKQALEDAEVLFNKDKGRVYNPMNRVIPTGANAFYDKKADINQDIMQKTGLTEEDIKKYGNYKPIKYS